MTEKMNQLMKGRPGYTMDSPYSTGKCHVFRVYFCGYTITFTRTFANIKRVVSRCLDTMPVLKHS